jgi:DNA mismatch repair protein MutS2
MYAEIKKLEFDKILKNLRAFAHTDLGKKEVLEISPINNLNEVKGILFEVEQAKIIIQRYDETPMTGVLDLTEIIKKSEIGSTLNIDEFLRRLKIWI